MLILMATTADQTDGQHLIKQNVANTEELKVTTVRTESGFTGFTKVTRSHSNVLQSVKPSTITIVSTRTKVIQLVGGGFTWYCFLHQTVHISQ